MNTLNSLCQLPTLLLVDVAVLWVQHETLAVVLTYDAVLYRLDAARQMLEHALNISA